MIVPSRGNYPDGSSARSCYKQGRAFLFPRMCPHADLERPVVGSNGKSKHNQRYMFTKSVQVLSFVNMSQDPKILFSYRLRQARAMRGWSLRQLAEAMSDAVSHTALAKYENAEMMPGSNLLVAIAEALQQPLDFFFRALTLKLEQVRFRKKQSLGKKAAEAIKESATDYFERYFEVEQITGDSRPFKGKLPGLVSSPDDAEEAAENLRAAWNLGSDPIPNVMELAEFHGIKVFEYPIEDQSFNGLSAETSSGPIMVLASWLSRNLPRKRMTAVHEIGHLVLTLPEDGSMDEKTEETIMPRFAGALMLPREPFLAAFGVHRNTISLEELIEMKCLFGVSIMAIMMRAKHFGLISESTATAFFIHANKHRWRKNGEPGDDRYRGQEQYSRFRQLVYRAVTEEKITLSRGAALLGLPLGEFREALRKVFG
jgi:Zn-dependent peptidase ImmA (M78 family)/ribosome-binding protein aMBF1 (putative translation factor)